MRRQGADDRKAGRAEPAASVAARMPAHGGVRSRRQTTRRNPPSTQPSLRKTINLWAPGVAPIGGGTAPAGGWSGYPSDGQKFHSIRQVFRFSALGDENQILDASTNRHMQLMSVDHTGKGFGLALPCAANLEEVPISSEKGAVKRCGARQEDFVVSLGMVVVLRGDNRNISDAQRICDAPRDMHIHIQPEAQADCFRSRKRRRRGESAVAAAMRSASANWAAISWSKVA